MLMLNRFPRVHSVARMHHEMNELFNNVFPHLTASQRDLAPPMNMWEDDQAYFIEAELPGYKMEDVDLTVLGNELTISGRREAQSRENAIYLRRERPVGEFSRTWTLPGEIDADKVEATLTHGVLLVRLPRTPWSQPRRIAISPGS